MAQLFDTPPEEEILSSSAPVRSEPVESARLFSPPDATAKPPEQSFLSRLGNALEGFSAGVEGRELPFEKRKLQERQLQMEEERMQLQRLTLIPDLLKTAGDLRDSGAGEGAVPFFKDLFNRITGATYDDKFFTGLLSDTGDLELLNRLLPKLSQVREPRKLLPLLKNSSSLKTLMNQEEILAKQDAAKAIGVAIKDGQVKAGMTDAEVKAVIPDAQFLSPEEFASYGIVPGKKALAKMMEKEAKTTRGDVDVAAAEEAYPSDVPGNKQKQAAFLKKLEDKGLSPRDAAFARLSPEEQRRVIVREADTDKLSLKEKQNIAGQIMGEARRQVEGQFKGILGQIDISSLGKTPEERADKYQKMIQETARELAQERGFSFGELQKTVGEVKVRKTLTESKAKGFFQAAKGNPKLATDLAKKEGFTHDEQGNPL